LTDSSAATILFASAGFGGGCSSGVYQKIVKISKNSFFILAEVGYSMYLHLNMKPHHSSNRIADVMIDRIVQGTLKMKGRIDDR
jgi:hypothetical protein